MDAVKTSAPAPAAQQPNAAAAPAYKHIRPEVTNTLFLSKLTKSRKLAQNNAATKTAAVKIGESEKAQNTPLAESQSSSNQGQVNDLERKKIEPKSKDQSRNALDEGIRNSVPASLEDMDEFKDSGKGKPSEVPGEQSGFSKFSELAEVKSPPCEIDSEKRKEHRDAP